MTETCELDPSKDDSKHLVKTNGAVGIKREVEVTIKIESTECVVCLGRNNENCDINSTNTERGTSVYEILYKYTHANIANCPNYSKFICKTCLDLVNVLEHAELEYLKVKEAFETIISKNPLFENLASSASVSFNKIKNEEPENGIEQNNEDSEDEPLALTKKKRYSKTENRKKKTISTSKRKLRKDNNQERWACSECNVGGDSGGRAALAAHVLEEHTIDPQTATDQVKKEDSPERPHSADDDDGEDDIIKLSFEDDDEDSSNLLIPLEDRSENEFKRIVSRKGRRKPLSVVRKKREKPIHECDKCNAKYTSIVRLEHHRQKHDDSKPPYICEVCGAHYKHKRACDIHVAMHKGISDWKCIECNKLFPSKGALQRHNNIHTGKLNYQCDLCGKSFIHTSSFKMHKLSHSGVKPHSCDVCGLALMTRSHLKRHKRVHSGEKRHECPTCGKRFSERYNLIAHSRAHDTNDTSQQTNPLQPDKTDRRRLFRCAFCTDRFERRYMLERHCALTHGRTLERPPPTPRNTMSKLLKAQAQRRDPSAAEPECKGGRSPETKSPPAAAQKTTLHSSSGVGVGVGVPVINASAWAGVYAAEFGLRQDYPH